MSLLLSDEKLLKIVLWPEGTCDAALVRELLRLVRRYIDLDCTIAFQGGQVAAHEICGTPLDEFLAEEPFIVHTHGSNAPRFFNELFPHLPKPQLIIYPPPFRFIGPCPQNDDYAGLRGKDFEALGVTGAVIIDDLPRHHIHAPECTILQPYGGLP